MKIIIFNIFIASLHAQNSHQKWSSQLHSKETARSLDLDSDGRNATNDYMDNLSDYEKMAYQSFLLSSKIYPDKLNFLLKARLYSNDLRINWMVIYQERDKGRPSRDLNF